MSPKLEAFVRDLADGDRSVDDVLAAIERAIVNLSRFLPTRKELAEDAQSLASDLNAYLRKPDDVRAHRRAWRRLAELKVNGDLWFFLRASRALSANESASGHQYLEEGRAWDALVRPHLPATSCPLPGQDFPLDVLAFVRDSALRLRPVLAVRGRAPDEGKLAFGIELITIWKYMTGKNPTYFGDATLGSPGTKFGFFTSLVIRSSPYAQCFETGFSHFLQAACKKVGIKPSRERKKRKPGFSPLSQAAS